MLLCSDRCCGWWDGENFLLKSIISLCFLLHLTKAAALKSGDFRAAAKYAGAVEFFEGNVCCTEIQIPNS